MVLKIEKNVEIPKTGISRFPLNGMEVGDSFLGFNKKDPIKQSSISTQLRQWALKEKNNWKFTIRNVDEGIRVWRTQ